MQLQFTQSIAAAEWSYDCGQVVTVGTQFTYDEVPAELAAKWQATGLLVPVVGEPEAAVARGRETAMRPAVRRRG